MAFVSVGTGILVLFALAYSVGRWWAERRRRYGYRDTAADVRARLQEADHEVAAAYWTTRRAMNDAVGQSWRNLTD